MNGQAESGKPQRLLQRDVALRRRSYRLQIRAGQGVLQLVSEFAKPCGSVRVLPDIRLRGFLPIHTFDERDDLRRAAGDVSHQVRDTPTLEIRWPGPILRRNLLYRLDEKTHRLGGPESDLRGRVVVH